MTRKQALQELRDKVAAGEWDTKLALKALPECHVSKKHEWVYPFSFASRAFHKGSLDAAKALHEAVLPGCSQYSIVTDPTCLKVSVCWWPDGLSGKREVHGEGWSEADPARAWLIAIIKAIISETEQ